MERRRSSRWKGKTCRKAVALAIRLAWVSIAPFGSPVVPEVKTTSTRSRGPIGCVAIGVASRARSGSDSMSTTGRPRPSASGAVWVEASTSLARVRRAILATKSGWLRMSTGTSTIPACRAPKKPIAHSGRLTAQISTRSPRSRPCSARTVATRGASSARSPYVQIRVLKPGLMSSAGRWR